jgi:nicotinamide mononucleotide transporter
LKFLSVDNVMLMVGDYPLSWIEFLGTLLYFASVWLIARKRMLTWPLGIVSVILYGILFWQIRLYSDMLEQVYYLALSVWGWVSWRSVREKERSLPTGFSPRREIAFWGAFTLAAGAALAFLVARVHLWLPALFPERRAIPSWTPLPPWPASWPCGSWRGAGRRAGYGGSSWTL